MIGNANLEGALSTKNRAETFAKVCATILKDHASVKIGNGGDGTDGGDLYQWFAIDGAKALAVLDKVRQGLDGEDAETAAVA